MAEEEGSQMIRGRDGGGEEEEKRGRESRAERMNR